MVVTSIEWTATPRADGTMAPGYSFNPWWGCTKVSPGCTHCYAETFAKRVGQKVWGVEAERRFFGDSHWEEPVRWNAAARAWPELRKVFCASMADVFEDRRDLDASRLRLWDTIRLTPSLDWLLLTKRPENIHRLTDLHEVGSRDNVWIGTTVENQEQAGVRIGHLVGNSAAVRFLSVEPLLGPVDLSPWLRTVVPVLGPGGFGQRPAIDWVIVGGESGPGARECDIGWIHSIVQQCKAADVPVFVKQLGARPIDARLVEVIKGEPYRARLKDSKGGNPAEWPEDLRVREFPREAVRA